MNHFTMDEGTSAPSEMEQKNLLEFGASLIKNSKGSIHCLSIIGQIEGHMLLPSQQKTTKYEHLLPLLVSIEENETTDGLLILINTVGGDVEAGLAISEMIAGMKKPTVSLVLGGSHSIGVPLAVSASRSFIAPSAAMTLHPVRLNGLVLGVPQSFNYINRIQDRVISFITKHSDISDKTLRKFINNTDELTTDIGSVLSGEETVNCGLIDQMGTITDALSYLYNAIKEQKDTKSADK